MVASLKASMRAPSRVAAEHHPTEESHRNGRDETLRCHSKRYASGGAEMECMQGTYGTDSRSQNGRLSESGVCHNKRSRAGAGLR